MFSVINASRKYSVLCLALIAFTCLPWVVRASSERRELIQGEAIVNEDVSTIPEEDRWPYTLALCVCKDGIPTSVICGATLIQPYVALTAGTLYNRICVFFGICMRYNADKLYAKPLQLIASKPRMKAHFLLQALSALFMAHQT